MKIVRIASPSPDQLKRDIEKLERQNKDLEKDLKEAQKDIKSLKKQIDGLNIGDRMYFQQKTVFNSLQRKIEKLEKVEYEWKKYKNEMEDELKRLVEKRERAKVG